MHQSKAPPSETSTLVFYSRRDGIGDIVRANDKGSFESAKSHNNWSKAWDIIVPGKFGGASGQDDLLFYTRNGSGSFFQVNTDGTIELIGANGRWAKTWTIIVAIRDHIGRNSGEVGEGLDRLLFYDKANAVGYFFQVNKEPRGSLTPLGEPQKGWASWDAIVALDFGLLCYRHPGAVRLFSIDSRGGLPQPLKKIEFGNVYLDVIVPCRFMIPESAAETGKGKEKEKEAEKGKDEGEAFRDSKSRQSDVLFYERATGNASVYSFNERGELARAVFENRRWAKGWSFILPGVYTGGGGGTDTDDLFCYDCVNNTGLAIAGNGQTVLAKWDGSDVSRAWAHVATLRHHKQAVRLPVEVAVEEDCDVPMPTVDGRPEEVENLCKQLINQRKQANTRIAQLEEENQALQDKNKQLEADLEEANKALFHRRGQKLDSLSKEELELLEEDLFKVSKLVAAKKAETVAREKEAEKKLCVICLENDRDTVLVDCSHLCCCRGCSERLTACPLCRKPVTTKLRVYDIMH